MMRRILLTMITILAWPQNAEAGPAFVFALSMGASLGAAFGATVIGTFLTTFTGRLLIAVGLTALKRAMSSKPRPAGITTQDTGTGGTNPCGFVLGQTATAGDGVCPPMSHGENDNGTPNAYLTYVIALGDIAGQTLERVAIDGEWVELGTTPSADFGLPVIGRYTNYAWVKYYDGSQTVADAMLLDRYGSYPERPWLADMIGTGVPYVICTFRFNRQLFTGFPRVLFQCGGIKLYDPRADSTAGGSGAVRWGDRSTWTASKNPIVMAYNISRGITLRDLGTWGGSFEAADLPAANWFAAMNECDVTIGTPAVAQYRAGIEVRGDDEPASIIEELLKGCLGKAAEAGGVVKVQVGGPGLPLYFMTDDDIIVSKAQDYSPFPGADQRQNGIDAKYPDPDMVWATKSAPARYSAAWEAEDGERRVVSLDLPACPYPDQVQRVMAAYIADERRFRRHGLTLPPDAAILEPLDVVSWTSARNGYDAKLFEAAEVSDDPRSVLQRLSVREVDSADYDWSVDDLIAVSQPSPVSVSPATHVLVTWGLAALSILDATGLARLPALKFTWDGTGQDGARGIEYELRLSATGALVSSGVLANVEAGEFVISTGLLPDTSYDGRLRIVGDWPTDWTVWDSATTPDLRITGVDIANGAVSERVFHNFSSGFSVTSGHVAASPKQIASPFSFTAVPYFGRPRVPDPLGWGPIALNPCVLSIMGEIRNDDASAPTTAHFVLQGRNGFSGAWTDLSDSYKILPISSDFVALSLRYIDVSASGGLGGFLQSYTTPYDEYRFVAYRGVDGGNGFTIQHGTSIILEQISK